MWCYYIIIGCTFFVSVRSHSFTNSLNGKRKDLDKEQALKCNSLCPFGFVSDIEGHLTCTCFDPCSNILCLQGTVCVAKMPENCQWEACRPVTSCVEEPSVVQTQKKEDYIRHWHDFPSLQRDAPLRNTKNDDDICSQSLPMAAVDCTHKRKRWYFNPMTGKCDRFMGCVTSGNNFERKIYCKEQCRYPYLRHKAALRRSSRPNLDNVDCSLPLSDDAFNCDQPSKRWFFNSRTKKCEKFIGCETTGNNFSQRSFCKSSCHGRNSKLNSFKDELFRDTIQR